VKLYLGVTWQITRFFLDFFFTFARLVADPDSLVIYSGLFPGPEHVFDSFISLFVPKCASDALWIQFKPLHSKLQSFQPHRVEICHLHRIVNPLAILVRTSLQIIVKALY
jgi:hypothetical protein